MATLVKKAPVTRATATAIATTAATAATAAAAATATATETKAVTLTTVVSRQTARKLWLLVAATLPSIETHQAATNL